MSKLRIEALARKHRSLPTGFRNQEASLVEYLRRFALRHAEKDLLARSYLAIHEEGGVDRLAGYFSLSTVSVERASVGEIPALSKLPGFPIPGVLLARLAVDARVQGQGLGRHLFDEALGLTLELAAAGPVAFRLFVADAINEDAVRFYERFGLCRLSGALPARMVLDVKPLLGPLCQDSCRLDSRGAIAPRIAHGIALPEFSEQAGVVTVTFRAGVGPEATKGPSRDQAGTKQGLSREQVQVLDIAATPCSLQELMEPSGRTNRTKFRDQVLAPLLEAGLLEMTVPDKPRSPHQKYRTTAAGAGFTKEDRE